MEKENENSEEKKILKNEEQVNLNEELKDNEVKEEKEEQVKDEKETKIDKEENVKEDKNEKKQVANKEKSIQSKENIDENKKEKRRKTKIVIIISAFFIIALLFFSTIFAIININDEKIADGVFIEDVIIYNKTKEEVNKIVNEKIANISEISITYGEYNESVKLEDLGIEVDAKEAIEKAITLGKTSNIIIDNYQILMAMLFEEHFDLTININQEKYSTMVKNIQAEIPEAMKEYSYEIKDEKLIIKNGKSGNIIDEELLKQEIIKNVKIQFNGEENTISIPVKYSEPQKIDIEKIYNEIYKEPKDAYVIEEPFELHKEENGIDFKITIDEAKQILAEEKETYTIPLKITKPKVAVKDLGDKLFKQTLAKYTTIYDAGDTNRGINIGLAAKAINGTILLPGEKFSYNGKVGDTTKEKGYKTGGAYVGGKVVQAYGGGICQLSSTLYNAVLYANLGIVERYNHSYAVGYVPAGRDATVSYGGKDFKFENTRKYPIKIVASAKNGVVSVSILGIKEEKEYEIELTSTVLSTTPYTTVYEDNSSLNEGTEKVIQKGYNGKKSIAYKIVKYNGKTISKTVLSKDTYKPMNRIVQVGTKKVATQTSTTVQTNTQPTTNNNETVQTPSTTVTTPTNTETSNIVTLPNS